MVITLDAEIAVGVERLLQDAADRAWGNVFRGPASYYNSRYEEYLRISDLHAAFRDALKMNMKMEEKS